MESKKGERSFTERRDETYLSNSVFGEKWKDELKELDKHEIVVRICDKMGSCPDNLHVAEEIFDDLKFDMARYVLHHEYTSRNGIKTKLLLWLDTKVNPMNARKVSSFFDKYLK